MFSVKGAKVNMARLNCATKNLHNIILAHLLINVKNLTGDVHLPKRPREKIKSRFTIFSSQENGSSLVSLKMIFETL